jgi:hypothetical protein
VGHAEGVVSDRDHRLRVSSPIDEIEIAPVAG